MAAQRGNSNMPYRQPSHEQRRGRRESDQRYDRAERPTTDALALSRKIHSSGRWQKVRQIILQRNPLCADPFGYHKDDGIVVIAEDVDHILGIALRPDLAFVIENLHGLCRACHAQKSAKDKKHEKSI